MTNLQMKSRGMVQDNQANNQYRVLNFQVYTNSKISLVKNVKLLLLQLDLFLEQFTAHKI